MKSVSLNIVMTYPIHWSTYQVLRDFTQNFYDAVGYDTWRQRFMYAYKDQTLTMWVRDVSFNYEWLMHIGASTKTDSPNGYAGFFGEGFKMAALCAFRDLKWSIRMMSEDWCIDVTEMNHLIDETPVKMLAYNISTVKKANETKLILKNVSSFDYDLFLTVLDSFFSPDNPIMGKKIWQGAEGAVFLRSKAPIPSRLPTTGEFGRKGAVFCRYQMLGTNPFNLVICLHKYTKEDRERKALYTFDVIHVFQSICWYVSPEGAMVMLEEMRRYWNTYPQTRIDINSWSPVIDALIQKVSTSQNVKDAFVAKYSNLLCLKKLYLIGERNRRWQAKSWLEQQSRKYILVKDTFQLLGYPLLEEECERHGGFVVDDDANALQTQCFIVLEEVCTQILPGFFLFDSLPKRKIITNPRAAYRGMAVTYPRKRRMLNTKGLWIRYDIGKIYLKSEIFRPDGYYDGLSTYVHEMCHMFGGDGSASFSLALTMMIEVMMENQKRILSGKSQWDQIFEQAETCQSVS